jgi:glycosyltransferase involved in cell wall biosynthesis
MKTITYIVCFDYPNLGSRGHRIIQMCKEWERQGFRTRIIIPFPIYYRMEGEGFREFLIEGIRVIRLYDFKNKLEALWKPALVFFLFSRFLRRFFRAEETDCVILSQMEPVLALVVMREARRVGLPVVSEYMDIVFNLERTQVYDGKSLPDALMRKAYYKFTTPVHNRLMRKVYEKSDILWLISEYLIKEARGIAPDKKIVKVPPIIKREAASKYVSREKIKSEYGIRGDFLVLYAGQFDRPQGVEVLIHAFKKLKTHVSNAALLLAGGGAQERLERLVKELAIDESVYFPGYLPKDKLDGLYQISDALISPKLPGEFNDAGFSTKVIDYLSSGTPTIASRLGEQALALKDKEHILFVKPGDAADLAEKLLFVHANKRLASKMGKRGQKFIIGNFTPPAAMKGAIESVRDLLEENGAEDLPRLLKKAASVF